MGVVVRTIGRALGATVGRIAHRRPGADQGDARIRAEHGIGTEIETIGIGQVNEAYERVLASDVRYRFVIDTTTLGRGRG